MWSFFHGWRRKLGSIALVMASVLLIFWMRSTLKYDCISFNRNPGRYVCLSIFGQIHCMRTTYIETMSTFLTQSTDYQQIPGIEVDQFGFRRLDLLKSATVNWRLDALGFHLSTGIDGKVGFWLCSVPYWSLVLPLTLAAAYLILRKLSQAPNPADSSQSSAHETNCDD